MFLDETAAAAAVTPAGGMDWTIILVLIVGMAAMYFFIMRPQKKQEKKVQQMRDNIEVGDEITTIGGIIGMVVSVKDETCMIETGKDKTKIRLLKSAVRCVDVSAADKQAGASQVSAPPIDKQ